MRRPTFDHLLLWTLLPLFALCFVLHVRDVSLTGMALPPIWARPAADGGYPLVGGIYPERGISWNQLRVGDRLVRIGEADLYGAGYFDFQPIATEQAGRSLRAPLVFEREGVRHEVEFVLRPYRTPWARIPILLSLAGTAVLVLVRAPGIREARLFFAALVSFAIFETPFQGTQRITSALYMYLFNFGGMIAIFLILRWVIGFPEDVPARDRLSLRWSWLAPLHLLVRLNYMLPTPIPSEIVPNIVLATDAIFGILGIGIVAWNYRHAAAIGRRRLKWLVYGGTITVVPLALGALFSALGVPGLEFARMFDVTLVAGMAIPLGVLIAIARYNLFDIDRLVTATASYSLLVTALFGAALVLVPALSPAVSQLLGIGPRAAPLLVGLALAGVAVPLGVRVKPRLDDFFYPERRALESGVEQLLAALSDQGDEPSLLRLVGNRVFELLRLEGAAVHRRRDDSLVPELQLGAARADAFAAGDPLARRLAAYPTPLVLRDREGAPGLDPAAQVVVPMRRGVDLAALLSLGPKRSGDVFTATDLALLGAVGERVSLELQRFRDAEVLEEHRQLARTLENLRGEAERANVAKSRFLAAASHDLRQPLHALGLFVATLAAQLEAPEERVLVQRIESSAETLRAMLDALLDLSRLDAEAIEPHWDDVPLAALLERLAQEFAPLAEAKGLRLRVVATSLVIRSDALLIGRIARNLVSNALRYTDTGGVLVGCRRRGTSVRIDVWDTGRGIPRERQQEIFREFTQIDPERAASDRGLGLGLSIVERLARLLDHELELRSRSGRGSRFSVSAPRSRGRPAARADAAAQLTVDLAGRRIAVVDDDAAVRESVGSLLRSWGCAVLAAPTAGEALAELDAGLDAILADYRLAGGHTGVEVVAQLRAACARDVPAVIITGDTAPELLAHIRDSGLPFLSKPVSPLKLRTTLHHVLRP